MHDFQRYFSRTFQTLKFNFQPPGLSRTTVIFQDYPGPGIFKKKSRTFQEVRELWLSVPPATWSCCDLWPQNLTSSSLFLTNVWWKPINACQRHERNAMHTVAQLAQSNCIEKHVLKILSIHSKLLSTQQSDVCRRLHKQATHNSRGKNCQKKETRGHSKHRKRPTKFCRCTLRPRILLRNFPTSPASLSFTFRAAVNVSGSTMSICTRHS